MRLGRLSRRFSLSLLCRHGLLAMLGVFLLSHPGSAGPAPVDLRAELGFGGWIVPGAWTPLRVEIAAREPLDGELVVSAGTASGRESFWRAPLQLGPGARQRLDLDVIVGDPRRPVVLSVYHRRALLGSTRIMTTALRVTEGIVLGLTSDAAGLEIVARLPQGLRPAYVRESQLPRRWQGYEGVALVVMRDLIDGRLLPVQREALIQWIAQGGRLLVTDGDAPALRLPWLRDVLPARAGVAARSLVLPLVSGTDRAVPVVEITPHPAADVTRDGGAAVSARWHYGRGVATVWAFDPLTPEARAWPTRRQLWSSLFAMPSHPTLPSADLGRVLPISQALPGRAPLGLAVLALLYVLAMRHVQRRWVPHTGWLGLIAAVVISGGLMYAYAVSARGSAIAATQVTVIEIQGDLRSARAATYVSIANAYGSTYRLRAPEEATIRALDGATVTYARASNDLASAGPGRGLIFESLQVIPQRVTARIVEQGSRTQLAVRMIPGLRIAGAVVFLRGRIYRLPDFEEQLSIELDPTKWEGVNGREGSFRGDVRGQIRSVLYARLRDMGDLRERPWLIGWVDDPRARVLLSPGDAGPALQLLAARVETGK